MPETSKGRLAGPSRPTGAPEIPQFHLPGGAAAGKAVYAPRLYGAAHVLFADKKRGVNETRDIAVLLPLDEAVRTVDWDAARETDVKPSALVANAPAKAQYLPLPNAAMQMQAFTRWAKQFDRWLARTQRVVITPKVESTPEAELALENDVAETVTIAPKRGGVTVELVAIVWELTTA